MPSLFLLLTVITIISIANQVNAYNFVEGALHNLQKHQPGQSKYSKNTYIGPESRDDEDDDSNVNSLSLRDVAKLIEQVLNTDAEYEVQKRTPRNKKQKHNTYLNKLNKQDLYDALEYYPDKAYKMPKQGLSYAKDTYSLKGDRNRVNQRESAVGKKQKYEKNFLDQLNELDTDNVILYDPDSYRPMRTEKKQKSPLIDVLGSKNHATDSDDLNDEALVYIIQLKGDAQRNYKLENRLNNLFSKQFELFSSSQKDRNDQRKERRYKGFNVKDAYRRRGDTREKFASEEAEEQEPVKRPRGFGGVARTPIPYIKHRGDIYEKYL